MGPGVVRRWIVRGFVRRREEGDGTGLVGGEGVVERGGVGSRRHGGRYCESGIDDL